MIILDTDCLSVLERRTVNAYDNLIRNLDRFSPDDIATTIITFEEQMRGWMAYLSRLKNVQQQVFAYETLLAYFDYFKAINIVSFDDQAAKIFTELKNAKIRVGTMDLKIASIVIATDSILISRNLKDFEQIPDLAVYDWTK